MKKFVGMVLTLLMVVASFSTFAGCKKDEGIVIWTFTDELSTMIEDYYSEIDSSTITVKENAIGTLTNMLDNAIRTNTNLPDIVALEEKVIRRFIDTGAFESLESIVGTQMYDYSLDTARDSNGNVNGLAWQVTPGAFFYRQSMAENILGLETPEKMQEKFQTWEGIMDAAATLKANGNKRIFSSVSAPSRLFFSQREQAWVVDGKLNIDPILTEGEYSLMEITRKLQTGSGTASSQDPYINETTETTTAWYADMSKNTVFGYFLPSWGLHYQLKRYAADANDPSITTAGDWRVIEGPGSYSDGGTWLCVLKSSPNKEKAMEIVKYLTSNNDFLSAWADETGDFVNNKEVMQAKAENYSDPFLGGQNHYAVLFESASKINGNNLTPYDSAINSMFNEWAINYAKYQDTKETAIAGFKAGVSGGYTSIIVE